MIRYSATSRAKPGGGKYFFLRLAGSQEGGTRYLLVTSAWVAVVVFDVVDGREHLTFLFGLQRVGIRVRAARRLRV